MRLRKLSLILAGCTLLAAAACWLAAQLASGHDFPVCTIGFPQNARSVSILQEGMDLRWSKGCLYAAPNYGDSRLVSSSGALALLGADGAIPLNRVAVMDARDGAILWRTPLGSATEIAADEEAFYVGGLRGSVERRSPLSGDLQWRTYVTPSRRVFALHLYDRSVYAYSNPNSLQLLDRETGRPIDTAGTSLLYTVHLILPEIAIGDSIRAEDLETNSMLWAIGLGLEVLETPVVVSDTLVVRTGDQMGHVVGIDIKSGRTLWQSEAEVVSNIATSSEGILFLTRDGMLHAVDPTTGSDSILLMYESPKLMLPSSLKGTVGGYYVAVDPAVNSLYVLLGDSGQLDTFAFPQSP